MSEEMRAMKAALRAEMLARRNAMTADAVAANSAAIAAEVLASRAYHNAAVVAAYMAIGNEVRTDAILRDALSAGKTVLLPRVHKNPQRLSLHAVSDFDALVPGPYGILEPPANAPEADPATVDVFLVPGVAFDDHGNRLGYGAGYYDSVLPHECPSAHKVIALAHWLQLMPTIPTESHDHPMDFIATELGVLDCRGIFLEDQLRLNNMTFYGHHGVYDSEREQGIRFAVDVELSVNAQVAGLSDDLTKTVNYPAVYRFIDELQRSRQFHLFEALAEAIARGILREFPQVMGLTVTARKFNPPVGGVMDAFEVEITRFRQCKRQIPPTFPLSACWRILSPSDLGEERR
jgi:5-formyltetrahydrofolate cyclo-ligase